MANTNTIVELVGGANAGTVKTLSNIGTTETVFTINPNPVTGQGGGAAVLVVPQSFDSGKPFRIRAQGTTTTNVSTTVAPKLYLGSDTNVSNDTAVFAPTAINVNSATSQWMISADLQWDSVSKKINGQALSRIGSTLGALAALTAVTANTASTLQFVLSGAFGAGNAANTLTVTEFSIEAI